MLRYSERCVFSEPIEVFGWQILISRPIPTAAFFELPFVVEDTRKGISLERLQSLSGLLRWKKQKTTGIGVYTEDICVYNSSDIPLGTKWCRTSNS